MGATSIEWTDATWNPVTGCTKVSAGCKNCYAETFAERFRGVPGHPYEQGFDLKLWPDRLSAPMDWKRPRRIFVNSMSDLFHEKIPTKFIVSVFRTMHSSPQHTFQVLTKRTARMAELCATQKDLQRLSETAPHIWLGTSVESQDVFGRVEKLASVDSAVRFLSCEPLLGPINFSSQLQRLGIHWVIAGGESGPSARPLQHDWVTGIRDQCQHSGVPFFFKQWGGKNKKAAGRELEGEVWDEFPSRLSGLSV